MRKFAVGKFLGIGHLVLFVTAIQILLIREHWGSRVLSWAFDVSHDIGIRVSSATMTAWQTHGIVHGANIWLSHLPWGIDGNTYFVLAVACLVTRLARGLPGWLSLVVALPAAVYGVIGGIAVLAWMAALWPLTAVTLIAAWIFAGATVSRY